MMENKLIHKILDNGLNIYLCPNQKKHSVVIDLIVKYGGFYSDFISDGKKYHMNDGMAHLLEHLLCEKNIQGSIWEIFGRKQMVTNAITWPWITEFYVDTVENVDYALENLILALSNPIFTKEDIEVTKPPIYQEIKMREDQLNRRVLYARTRNLFKNISFVSGLGTQENVKNFTYEQVKLCYNTFYQPKNEILFISGNFEPKEMYEKIQNIYQKVSFNNITFEYIKVDEPKEVEKKYDVIVMPVAKDYIDVCYKVDFSMYSNEKRRMLAYYLSLFLTLNFSNISPLCKELIDQGIIETSLVTNFEFYQDYLVINAGAYINDEKVFIKRVQDVFTKERYGNNEVFDLRLKKMKIEQICSDATPNGITREFIDNVCLFDYPGFDTIEELNNLNYANYLKFIASLEFKNYTVTKVTNSEEE